MADSVETIKIVKDNGRTGYAIINKSDFNPKVQKEFKDKPTPDTGAQARAARKTLEEEAVALKIGTAEDIVKMPDAALAEAIAKAKATS
jgi:hypothetical protein